MADLITWFSDIMGMELATVGTVTVTLGLTLALSVISALVLRIYRKVGGR